MTVVAAPEHDVVIVVIGDGGRVTLDSIDALRNWVPGFDVRCVQILDDALPVEPEARNTQRGDTCVYDLSGQLAISAFGVEPALAAYAWAYGLSSLTS